MRKNFPGISWLIESILIGFALTVFFALVVSRGLNVNFNETGMYILLAIFTVIGMLVNYRRRPSPKEPQDKKSQPSHPEMFDAPQFKGRVDRKRGIVEATARMVQKDRFYKKPSLAKRALWPVEDVSIDRIQLRAELLDEEGNANYVPVVIMGKTDKFVGTIIDGDRFSVKGKFRRDGILYSKKAFNYSMKSIVGER